MALDLKIVGGLVVTDGTATMLDVGIEGETVVEVAAPGSLGRAVEEIDATGRYVMPGAVDAHFHCRAPSHPERGDFASETRAAAAGGVTTVFEMPISDPACSTPEVLTARRRLAEEQCVVDFALFGGGAVTDRSQVQAMAELGAIGFKMFTHAPAANRAREFEGLWATDEVTIYRALEAVASTGLVCTVHAENEALLRWFSETSVDGIPRRPPVIESTAISMVAAIAAAVGAKVHIAHLSSIEGLAALRAARATDASVTAETCPQYLMFDETWIRDFGAFAKIAPPLRPPGHADALWQALADGDLTLVSSDHAPFLPEEKIGVPYASAPQGIPTIETMLPILLDAAARGVLPLTTAVDLVTSAPARRFGIHPRKGTVSPGADADLVLFTPSTTTELGVGSLLSRAAGTGRVYEGIRLQGTLDRTISRGETVFLDGIASDKPRGRFVSPGA